MLRLAKNNLAYMRKIIHRYTPNQSKNIAVDAM